MRYSFTKEQMEHIEKQINGMGEILVGFVEYLSECGLCNHDIREIDFLNNINTALSFQVEGLKDFISEDTYEKFKKNCDVFDFENVTLNIIPKSIRFPEGTLIQIPGKVNFGNGEVKPFAMIISDEEIGRVYVNDSSGKEFDICLECFDALIFEDRCQSCGCGEI